MGYSTAFVKKYYNACCGSRGKLHLVWLKKQYNTALTLLNSLRTEKTNDSNQYSRTEIYPVYAIHSSSLSKPGTYITQNATYPLSDISRGSLSDYMQLPLEPQKTYSTFSPQKKKMSSNSPTDVNTLQYVRLMEFKYPAQLHRCFHLSAHFWSLLKVKLGKSSAEILWSHWVLWTIKNDLGVTCPILTGGLKIMEGSDRCQSSSPPHNLNKNSYQNEWNHLCGFDNNLFSHNF